jgi:hypothetical protein
MRGLEAGGSCGLGGYKASSQHFYPLGCLRLVPVFFQAHLAADYFFLVRRSCRRSRQSAVSNLQTTSSCCSSSLTLMTILSGVPSVLHTMALRCVVCEFPVGVVLRSLYSPPKITI